MVGSDSISFLTKLPNIQGDDLVIFGGVTFLMIFFPTANGRATKKGAFQVGAGAVLMKQAEDDKVETAVTFMVERWRELGSHVMTMCSHFFLGGGWVFDKRLAF